MQNVSQIIKSRWLKLILGCFIFVISLAVYYYPIHKKGYPPNVGFTTLSQARNFAISGTYNYESQDGVLLASTDVKEKAKAVGLVNPLTPIIYGQIYKYFGPSNISLSTLVWMAVVLAALLNVLIFLLITKLFGLTTGFISGITTIFFPLRASGALSLVYDEFGLILFVIALWLYLGGKSGPFKASDWRITLSSIFFGLTALARNAFLFSFLPFVIFDFYVNRSYKRTLMFVVPFILIFVSTLTPYSWLGVPNGYISDFDSQPFGQIGHVFDDPYSAYYDKANAIKLINETEHLDRLRTHYFKGWGYDISFSERLDAYLESASFYLTETFDITNLGGPLILFFMGLGAYFLYRNKRDILKFFGLWLVIWFLGLIYFETSNRSHYLEILLVWSSLAGLGVYQFLQYLSFDSRRKALMGSLLLLLFIGHLSYASRYKIASAYETSGMKVTMELYDKFRQRAHPGTIAVGLHTTVASGLHYLTDQDIIYFDDTTVKKLIETNKLKEAFDIYKVKTALGFPESYSSDIRSLTGAEVIAR